MKPVIKSEIANANVAPVMKSEISNLKSTL